MSYSLQQIYSLPIYKHSLKRKEVDLQAINHATVFDTIQKY